MPEGFLSEHLVRGLEPGTVVRLAPPQGNFVLPDPPPARMLFLTAGSGITPVVAMLRTLDRRGSMPDVVLVQSAPNPERMLFRAELRRLAATHPAFRYVERYTETEGRLSLDDATALAEICPDWQDRAAWACGPEAMLTAAEQLWEREGATQQLTIERFTADLAVDGEAGQVTFARSGKTVEVDGATTLLDAGEGAGARMPAGCRMGICHTCVVPLLDGAVRDLRSGEQKSGRDAQVQTCISAPLGDCVLDV